MSDPNENLAALVKVAAELESKKNNPRCPAIYGSTPKMLLNDDGVPIVLHGVPIDFESLVQRAKVVHPVTLTCSTLQAVVDYFANSAKPGSFVQIESPVSVHVYEGAVEADGRRHLPLSAGFSGGPPNRFGEWLPVEDFGTWLLSSFDDDPALPGDGATASDLGALRWSLRESVTHEAVRQAADGGGGVELKTSEGVNVKWYDGIGPRFKLGFLCTFPEVVQPKRLCVFRARNAKAGIEVKLADADGGAWATIAIGAIAAWLRGKLGDVTILG